MTKILQNRVLFFVFKGTRLRSSSVTHLKIETLYFRSILWYLNMSYVDLATRFKIEMYMLNREKRY